MHRATELLPIVTEFRHGRDSSRAVFLDRDGVLNRNRADYVRSVSELTLLPGVVEAVRILDALGYDLVIVTNQACIGKGIVPRDEVLAVNEALVRRLGLGLIGSCWTCPHASAERCACRKPSPGMLLGALERYSFDAADSYFVGDAYTDALAAQHAGVVPVVVRTGRWREDQILPPGTQVHESLRSFAVHLHATDDGLQRVRG